MKSRRFVLAAGSSFMAVLATGCASKSVSQKSAPAPTSESLDQNSSPGGEAASSPANPPSPTPEASEELILSSGSFVAGEHPTQGTVRITNQSGKRVLELDQAFKTSTFGPDLFVVLHRSPDVIGSTVPPAFPINEGDYVLLAPLKSYSGAQSYDIPDNVKLDEFKSAAIWCRLFNATFGAATLKPSV